MKLLKYFTLARIIYFFLAFFTFFIFYSLSTAWSLIYRIFLTLIPVVLTLILIKLFFILPLENLNNYIIQHRIIKLLTLILALSLIFTILIFYQLPDYFFMILFILTFIFFYSSYYVIYFISVLTIFFIFLIFQIFYLEQRLALDYLEYQNRQTIKKQILESIDYKFNNNEITIKSKNELKQISIRIPNNFERIQTNQQELNFPLIYIGKPKDLELPIFSCFLIGKEYPFYLLDLRIQSILLDLKKNSRINDFSQIKNPFLSSIYKDKEIYNQFYVFFDRFYAENIQIGFYAIPFDQFYLILWIRETQKKGFPHDKYILEILNSLNL